MLESSEETGGSGSSLLLTGQSEWGIQSLSVSLLSHTRTNRFCLSKIWFSDAFTCFFLDLGHLSWHCAPPWPILFRIHLNWLTLSFPMSPPLYGPHILCAASFLQRRVPRHKGVSFHFLGMLHHPAKVKWIPPLSRLPTSYRGGGVGADDTLPLIWDCCWLWRVLSF